MQHKLATWAEDDPNRRFDRLLRLIANREWLAEAARVDLASSGARTPGIHGMDKQGLQVKLDQHLDEDQPAGGELSPPAGQAHLYPESQWEATTTRYSDLDGSHTFNAPC